MLKSALLDGVLKVEVHLQELVSFTNRLPYRSGRGSQYPSMDGRVGSWTVLNALEKTLVPTLGTICRFIGHFGWRHTREATTLKIGGKWRNDTKSCMHSLPGVEPLYL
jgi:hypothetical protein